ncbi:MAG: T9SS type A sorting domain-containing protein [Bacteroidota bacterium]|jgi:hypothetical protein
MKQTISFFFLLFITFRVGAQCNPDMTITVPGIYPDSATNLPPAFAAQNYSVVMTAVVPADTQALPFPAPPIPITSIKVGTVTCTPPITGFNFACNVPNCAFPGGQTNCGVVTAAPTAADIGIHYLTVPLTVYTTGNFELDSYTLTYYRIEVFPAGTAGLFDINSRETANIFPNPYSLGSDQAATILVYGTKAEKCMVRLFSVTGSLVWEQSMDIAEGKNTIPIDATLLGTGVYHLSLNYGGKMYSSRWVITR